jgi:hypothetical protein
MAGMGPPPKHPSQRRRTNATISLTQLPAEGRQGDIPAWPLMPDVALVVRRDLALAKAEELRDKLNEAEADGKPGGSIERRLDRALEAAAICAAQLAAAADLEQTLWRDLWRLPQAVQWDRLGWMRDVAQYVRHKTLGELGDLKSAQEARMWSDRLGLNPQAMLRLRWEVVADELAGARDAKAPAARSAPRLRAVEA